ncbi:DUF222 domain-containing protein [Gordonia sp. CPCC 206044]|uniref:HNH endonuclease signature motif containing protein n=1 Tax=Gordonia sp. CPCC 206044 TaxID=3140793 RepID=UPI003AF3F180
MNDLDAVTTALLDLLGDWDVSSVDDATLVSAATRMVKIRNATDGVLLRLAAEIDRRGAARRLGAASTGQWFTSLGISPFLAYRWVRDGAALRELPTVSRDAADGGLSGEHVHAVIDGLAHVAGRAHLNEEQRAHVVRQLLAHAHTTSPPQVSARARAIAIELAPSVERKIPVAEDRSLNMADAALGADGRVHGRFDLDCVIGEKLLATVNALSRPAPQHDGSPDPRNDGQRRADAIEIILDNYLQGDNTISHAGGHRPHVTLTLPAGQAPRANISDGTSTVDGSTVATLAWTGPVSAATAELISCDSEITTILLDSESVPLDVKRKHRIVTPAIRQALIVRDKGCAFPGCTAPPAWAEAHHIVHWEHMGDTSLDNCVLLCRRHHTAIHHTGWDVVMGDDRHPWFVPPESLDATRTPVRSQARRTLTNLTTAA